MEDILGILFVVGMLAGCVGIGLVIGGIIEIDKPDGDPNAKTMLTAGIGLLGVAGTLILGVLSFFQ